MRKKGCNRGREGGRREGGRERRKGECVGKWERVG